MCRVVDHFLFTFLKEQQARASAPFREISRQRDVCVSAQHAHTDNLFHTAGDLSAFDYSSIH